MVSPGQRLEISYPVCNTILRFSDYQRRRVEVRDVRDMVATPLLPAEFMRRPYVRRSRYMISAVEMDTGRLRKFYLGASREFLSPSVLRIGLYASGDCRPYRLIGPEFESTVQHRRQMVKLLKLLNQQDLGDLYIGIVATDLRLVA